MFQIISIQLVKMFLLIMVGAVCRRTEIFSSEGNKTLANMLLYVVNPLVILNAFQLDRTPELMRNLGIAAVLAFGLHALAILISMLVIRKKGNDNYGVELCTAIYTNCGFMGIPLVMAILGEEGVIYLTVYMIAFNVLIWTHGMIVMTGNTNWQQLKKGLLSPVIFATVIGFIMFMANIKMPAILSDTVGYLTALNTPIGMMVAGCALAEADLLGALRNKRVYFMTAVSLLLMPAVALLVLRMIPISQILTYTMLIAVACPAGTTCTMFALKFDKDYRYASELFTFTTAASLLTIPMVVWLAEHVL